MKKKIYYVSVNNIPPEEIDEYMEKLINKMKKIPYQSKEELERLGYITKLTKWQKIKRWFKDFATFGDFTGFGGI